MRKILALDLGKSKTAARLHRVGDRNDFVTTVPTKAQDLHDLIVSTDPALIIIEVCSITWWVHDLARALGKEVLVTANNGPGWRRKNVRNKSDRTDAAKLIKMYLSDQLEPVHVPSREVRQWRDLIKHRHKLVRDRTRLRNRITGRLSVEGVELPPETAWTGAWLEIVRAHARPLPECGRDELWRGQLHDHLSQLDQVDKLIAQVERMLDDIAKEYDCIEVLRSEPGVGPRLSEAIAAVIDDPLRFDSGRQVACYAGLTPRHWSSGASERSGGISKQGSRLLRTLLIEVSWLALRHNEWMREVFRNVKRGCKNRRKIAIVAVARRLLVRLWARWRDAERAKRAAPA